jgi:hypothetical protein
VTNAPNSFSPDTRPLDHPGVYSLFCVVDLDCVVGEAMVISFVVLTRKNSPPPMAVGGPGADMLRLWRVRLGFGYPESATSDYPSKQSLSFNSKKSLASPDKLCR